MTNLEKLLQNDEEVLDFVLKMISNNFCINPETMKNTAGIRCKNCPFSAEANDNVDNCEELEKIWLKGEYLNELHGQDDAD